MSCPAPLAGLLPTTALLALLAGPAVAAPVQWSGNGHWYEAIAIPTGITWSAAYDSCQKLGGYLATPTSSAEHAFIYGLISGRPELWFIDGANNGEGPWIGGFQPPGSGEPGGGWRWVTDEPWSYTAWSPGEPNNSGGNENSLVFFRLGGLIGDRFNDAPGTMLAHGFVFEKQAPAVECSTWTSNGHLYQIVRTPGRISWTAARDAALGRGGHLATITSSSENAFVASMATAEPQLWTIDTAGNGQGPWIGGYQPAGSPEPAGGWSWVSGDPWGFTAWASGEPNNLNGVEHYTQLFGKGALTGSQWNDMSNTTGFGGLGYVIEYEGGGGCATTAVPEGGMPGLTFPLLHPNPTRGPVAIELDLPRAALVGAEVVDLAGRCVRRLASPRLAEAGSVSFEWDGRSDRGEMLANGVYFVRVRVGGRTLARKLVLAY